MNHTDLIVTLKSLRLFNVAENYVEIAKSAVEQNLSYEKYLAAIASSEFTHRQSLKTKKLLRSAKLPLNKYIEKYRFEGRKGITSSQVEKLSRGEWIRNAENIIFFGSFGLGKTHLAIGLVRALCENGFRCHFISTNKLIDDLLAAKKELTLTALFRRFDNFDLIACDELGYIPQTQEGADLFFQFISQRYERKSLLITTNLTYSEWDKVFLNPVTTAAAVDRIIHHSETYNIEGDISWRTEEAQKKLSLTKKLA